MGRWLILVTMIVGCGARTPPSGRIEGSGSDSGSNAAGGNSLACPATYATVPVGTTCAVVDAACAYPEGACTCAARSYCGGVAPSQATLDALRQPSWQCTARRTDGCPEQPPTGACATEGQRCGYGDCCFQTDTCTHGQWVAGAPQCPP
jgi:hypothetical protein